MKLILLLPTLMVACSSHYRSPTEELERLRIPGPYSCQVLSSDTTQCEVGGAQAWKCTVKPDADAFCSLVVL